MSRDRRGEAAGDEGGAGARDDTPGSPRSADRAHPGRIRPVALDRTMDGFERAIVLVLMVMMVGVVVLAVAELAWVLVRDLRSPPVAFLDPDELLDVFGAFLLVLIGIELLETLRAYVRERVIRAEVILLVALIALARKIIILEVKATPGSVLLGIAAIVVALGIAYSILRRAHDRDATARAPGGS